MKLPERVARFWIGWLCLMVASSVWSHGGEDHHHEDEPVLHASPMAIPRATAQSENFELVAVLADQQLTLYLDDYGSNAPVADARIEIESGEFKEIAQQIEPGVYRVSGTSFKQPGNYPLVFSIATEASADLLTTMLQVSSPAPAQAATGLIHDHHVFWGIAAAVTLLIAGVTALRRRHVRH